MQVTHFQINATIQWQVRPYTVHACDTGLIKHGRQHVEHENQLLFY